MATTDKRNTISNLYVGGTDVGIQVLLSDAEADDIYGTTDGGGWYIPFTLDGGNLEYEVEEERDIDSAGKFTGRKIEKGKLLRMTDSIKETDDATQDLIDKYLSKTPHKYRLGLPTTTAASKQVFGLYNATMAPGWSLPMQADEKRLRGIEITAEEDTAGNPAYVRSTVTDFSDQSGWPSELDDFKDPA